MSQITRCPACSTQFKVVADQLRISEGWVRCGHCAEVFDASAFLSPAPPPALLPDVSLTDVRSPPVPVARRDESAKAWGADPVAAVPGAAKVPSVGHSQAPAAAAPAAPTPYPSLAPPPVADVMAVPDPVLPAFLAAGSADGRIDPTLGPELALEPLAPFSWGAPSPAPKVPAVSPAAPIAPVAPAAPAVQVVAPVHAAPVPPAPAQAAPVQPVVVERQESQVLSANMLELVLKGTRAPVSTSSPALPSAASPHSELGEGAAEASVQSVAAPVPMPGGYELPYAEDFADTALLPEGFAGDMELPSDSVVPVAVLLSEENLSSELAAFKSAQVPSPYPPLELPVTLSDADSSAVAKGLSDVTDAGGMPQTPAQKVPTPPAVEEPQTATASDALTLPQAAAVSTEATGVGAGAMADAGSDRVIAPALPSVAFPPLAPEQEHPSSRDAAKAIDGEPQERDVADEDDDAAVAASPSEDVSFVKAARRRAFWRKPQVRVALFVLCLGLVGVLMAQVAVHERNRLAAMEPRLRPALLALCEPMDCVLAPQRQIGDVVIDSSSFNKARGDSYVLAITMKSRANLPLEMPAVELTLTDAQDQPVLRRVLLPAEMSAPQELPAGGEWNASVSILVTTGGSRVAGYRLLAFYP